jgi:hypothetical protein
VKIQGIMNPLKVHNSATAGSKDNWNGWDARKKIQKSHF